MKTIKDMPEHSRPREKLRERSASDPTDMEAKIETKLGEVWGEYTSSGGSNA